MFKDRKFRFDQERKEELDAITRKGERELNYDVDP
jgi:hypothetical protein